MYPPTRCGLATFSAALARGLNANGSEVSIVRVSDGQASSSSDVVGELVNGSAPSAAACVELLNHSNVAVIQHDYGSYGGVDGDETLGIIDGLTVPSIVVVQDLPKSPTPQQILITQEMAARADQVVAMSEAAGQRLYRAFDIDRSRVAIIRQGATISVNPSHVRGGRPTLLTWGLLGPGKGIERVIEAMSSLRDLPGNPRYVVAGPTHPKVLAADGEAYRDALVEQARRSGLSGSVLFDAGYRSGPMLSALVQSAAAVVLPYDSTDQVSSGVLIGAIASGRPVVATAFPHAVEVLSGGAGLVVAHDRPDALSSALRQVLTEPRLAGAMAAEARRLAPEMAWPLVARTYQALARRILARRRARL
ncbi:D-inositol-3-phosphate glycosyltransferase [Mycobacterium marinum]|uniref:D-inositol-3-phosphate glycosyltransferase n=1 Tax=Mycobacterium marinum TaxID=1781 RepID=A0A2Z5YEY1_MYCMR|nr:glycosyltransferase [Mycobacterium marinum]EPQ80188.1 glycosyl transferase, group 1 [Mycobacterium marinum str. Europe]AXN44499.1 D-inositol-3-phosphate glycosyltransferase [Mycobacterium marinum]AXN49861.1 D-inositol-3-phosphate glycosyltransferase [Mycobacterium marinum]RFZ12512.1 D-inositol-3-phosphate glycosyltransferase [Mycobacterium marinum]RFZ15686.1 D-inositol-3-phosphate glycosyltransferase [Mycobacterium marinum]